MNIFIILGWLLWLGIVAVFFLGFVAVLIVACVRKSRKLALWSTVPLLAIVMVTGGFFGVAYLWFRPYDPTSAAGLKEAYKADFGTLPPTGVTVVKARQVVVADAGAQWLLLTATSEEIDRHIAMGFQKAKSVPADFNGMAGANAPKWWRPPATGLDIYVNTNWSKAGGWYEVKRRWASIEHPKQYGFPLQRAVSAGPRLAQDTGFALRLQSARLVAGGAEAALLDSKA